jgi:NADH dehydrogenase
LAAVQSGHAGALIKQFHPLMNKHPHILVLGAGFGGLTFCQSLRHTAARVTLVDRTNHHLFQPLLYQVAASGLSAPEIAQPIRAILSNRANITVLLDQVVGIDLTERRVTLESNSLTYDYLVLGLGGVTSYFGHPEWEEFAPGLKTLDDALRMRSRILLAFERAEIRAIRRAAFDDRGRRRPDRRELAAFAELARTV